MPYHTGNPKSSRKPAKDGYGSTPMPPSSPKKPRAKKAAAKKAPVKKAVTKKRAVKKKTAKNKY